MLCVYIYKNNKIKNKCCDVNFLRKSIVFGASVSFQVGQNIQKKHPYINTTLKYSWRTVINVTCHNIHGLLSFLIPVKLMMGGTYLTGLKIALRN